MIRRHLLRTSLAGWLLLWFISGGHSNSLAGERPDTLHLIAAGDLMVGSWVKEEIRRNGYDYPFRQIQPLLKEADLVFANLEAPFGTRGTPVEKTYTFLVDTALVGVLKAGRVNLVSIANNHILDYGEEALQETMQLLKRQGIAFGGAGRNLTEARRAALLQIKGTKIALVAYSLTFPKSFWATDSSAGACFPSHTFVYRDIQKLKRENDLVIVSCHWGEELRETPKPYQVKLAHRLINAGADVVLGHHPHVVQGIEVYRGKIIAYSLGNFIFGSYSENVRDSMILSLKFAGNEFLSGKVFPLWVYNREVNFQPRLLEGNARTRFLEKLNNLSRELNSGRDVISNDGIIGIKN